MVRDTTAPRKTTYRAEWALRRESRQSRFDNHPSCPATSAGPHWPSKYGHWHHRRLSSDRREVHPAPWSPHWLPFRYKTADEIIFKQSLWWQHMRCVYFEVGLCVTLDRSCNRVSPWSSSSKFWSCSRIICFCWVCWLLMKRSLSRWRSCCIACRASSCALRLVFAWSLSSFLRTASESSPPFTSEHHTRIPQLKWRKAPGVFNDMNVLFITLPAFSTKFRRSLRSSCLMLNFFIWIGSICMQENNHHYANIGNGSTL